MFDAFMVGWLQEGGVRADMLDVCGVVAYNDGAENLHMHTEEELSGGSRLRLNVPVSSSSC